MLLMNKHAYGDDAESRALARFLLKIQKFIMLLAVYMRASITYIYIYVYNMRSMTDLDGK